MRMQEKHKYMNKGLIFAVAMVGLLAAPGLAEETQTSQREEPMTIEDILSKQILINDNSVTDQTLRYYSTHPESPQPYDRSDPLLHERGVLIDEILRDSKYRRTETQRDEVKPTIHINSVGLENVDPVEDIERQPGFTNPKVPTNLEPYFGPDIGDFLFDEFVCP